jgi:large subunit ribosomal protein L6
MSRIGRRPIDIPDDVKVSVSPNHVSVEGPQGKLTRAVLRYVKVVHDAAKKKLKVERASDVEQARMNHGTMRAHLANMLAGVSKGFEKNLRISGVGYGAKVAGTKIVLTLGYSHPVEMDIPQGLKVTCPSAETISVRGADRQIVGHFSALIRAKRPVEPYNLKGIKYEDEVVKKKAGKTFVSGA